MNSFVALLMMLVVSADEPYSNPVFGAAEPPLNRGARGSAPATPFNRLDAGMRLALQERARRIAIDHRSLDDIARRQAMKSDLYWYANANFDVLTQPWQDAELAFLQNLVDDTARPYDVGLRPTMKVAVDPVPPPPDDFIVRRWYSGKVRGKAVMVWAVRDPNNAGNLLVDRREQMPEVQALMGGETSLPPSVATFATQAHVEIPPAVTYTYASPTPTPLPQMWASPTISGVPMGIAPSRGIFGGAGFGSFAAGIGRMGGGCVGGSCAR